VLCGVCDDWVPRLPKSGLPDFGHSFDDQVGHDTAESTGQSKEQVWSPDW
jgi:hypothetical protein